MKADFKPLKVSLTERPPVTAESHERAISKLLSIAQRTMSSAYDKRKKGKEKLRLSSSSIRMFQRKGERTLPCSYYNKYIVIYKYKYV